MTKRRQLHRSIAAVLAICCPALASADEIWTVRGGTTTIELNASTLEKHGLTVEHPGGPRSAHGGTTIVLPVEPDSTLAFVLTKGLPPEFLGGRTLHGAGLVIRTKQSEAVIEDVALGLVDHDTTRFVFKWSLSGMDGAPGLAMGRHKAGFDRTSRMLTMHSPELRITKELAETLGDKRLAGLMIGSLTLTADVEWVGGSEPEPIFEPRVGPTSKGGGLRDPVGCDMTYCQLYDFIQMGRTDDRVGLSVATTSWNIGDADCQWFDTGTSRPEDHPFIIMGVYRLKSVDGSERFENIGWSAIKHGFYALPSEQCGTDCTFEPGHGAGDWLGMGCTDTYSAYLNGNQSGMGPRHEINPWTGDWTFSGSHMDGFHNHSIDPPSEYPAWEHRIAVYDDDLDPAMNPGATYYCESFYCMADDTNAMNSAAWKETSIASGSPGGDWDFDMSGATTMAEVGFAIDAWAGAKKSLIAQEHPVVEFSSPDGRCILAAKATDLGGGTWHYEYALLNIDMDRKVGSFSVPVVPGTIVTNIGFHGPDSSERLASEDTVAPIDNPYSNDPWPGVFADGAVSWTTVDNPIRWNTLYNFRFDANVPPLEGTSLATVGLFEAGTPDQLPAKTIVPHVGPPDCDGDGVEDECELDCGEPDGACDVPGCGTSDDCNDNGLPDDCEPDCNGNGIADECDVPPLGSFDTDCNANLIPDDCEPDCNDNGIADECDVPPIGSMEDCNGNLIPDVCEPGYVCDNNLCTNAMVIWAGAPGTPATYSGSTIGAQPDGDAACQSSTSTGPDLWYSFTPSASGSFVVETCNDTDFDTYLSLHAACPGTQANQLACSDDDCATTRSQIYLPSIVADTEYLIRVSGVNDEEGNFTLTVLGPESAADPIRGGRLWDNWMVVAGVGGPSDDHPLYPPEGQQTGSTTYRCKECHGWDFKGANGAYGSGSHYTGISGVLGSTLSPSETFQIIRNDDVPNGHGFHGYGLSDADIWDLVDFMQTHVIETDAYISPATASFIGNPAFGENYYDNPTGGLNKCSGCHDEWDPLHGYRGTQLNFGTSGDPQWIGTVAVDNPWEFFHKVRFGQPGEVGMPIWLSGMPPAGTNQGAANIGAFAQTTAFAYNCTDDSYCDTGGDPCVGTIIPCLLGRCTITLDGDINMDSATNGLDIQNFVQAVINESTNPDDLARCDFSENGMIDEADVPCMVDVLLR